ncbi:MAG: NAD(P)H-dependent oxidoreductase [Succinivibrio sp.]|jgi:NAD(P)H dehydrogenase (quinone)|nr:NAD(P)H-dependent oxidoreductase [Succinivibrio sp.]
MKKVLVISGHPALGKGSTANAAIISEFQKLCPNAEIRDLGSLAPDFKFDVKAEQQALVNADIVIIQFPVYWYSVPALLKKWAEDVLEHGFAYGTGGDKLHGKDFILSCTFGAGKDAYEPKTAAGHTVNELFASQYESAQMIGMHVRGTVVSYGMMYIPGVSSDQDKAKVLDSAKDHAQRLFSLVSTL